MSSLSTVDQFALKLAPFCDAVVVPVPATVTCAVEVKIDVPGAYCTRIVQLPPAAIADPFVQVPPVIEKPADVGPAVFVTVGAAVNVNGPVEPAALVTVIVAFFAVRFPGAVVIAGAGAEMASVAPVTVKVPALVATPPGNGPRAQCRGAGDSECGRDRGPGGIHGKGPMAHAISGDGDARGSGQ